MLYMVDMLCILRTYIGRTTGRLSISSVAYGGRARWRGGGEAGSGCVVACCTCAARRVPARPPPRGLLVWRGAWCARAYRWPPHTEELCLHEAPRDEPMLVRAGQPCDVG